MVFLEVTFKFSISSSNNTLRLHDIAMQDVIRRGCFQSLPNSIVVLWDSGGALIYRMIESFNVMYRIFLD